MLSSPFTTFLSLALIAKAVSGRPASCEAAAAAAGRNGKAVYIITNEKENQVLALPIDKSGILSSGTCIGTGGEGSVAVDASNNPAVPDALLSQSSLTIAGNVRDSFKDPLMLV